MRDEIQAARILLAKMGADPSPVSPWTAQAEDRVQQWAAAFGLVRSPTARNRFRGTAPGELSGRVYALAADRERLKAAALWIGWLFLIDDQLDEGATGKDPVLTRERLRPFAAMAGDMAAGSAPASHSPRLPLLAALVDVWRQVSADMPAGWRTTFTQNYLDYLCGCEWEAGNRARGRIPAESEFLPMRRAAGAIWPSLDLLEYVCAAPVPDPLRGDPLFTGIRTACADVVCWTDDLLTVGKERAHGDMHNLAIVLEHAMGCGPREALEVVAKRIEARLIDFEELRRRVATAAAGTPTLDDDGKYALDQHIEGLQHWMRGHLEWSLRTIRYDPDANAASSAYLEDLLG